MRNDNIPNLGSVELLQCKALVDETDQSVYKPIKIVDTTYSYRNTWLKFLT